MVGKAEREAARKQRKLPSRDYAAPDENNKRRAEVEGRFEDSPISKPLLHGNLRFAATGRILGPYLSAYMKWEEENKASGVARQFTVDAVLEERIAKTASTKKDMKTIKVVAQIIIYLQGYLTQEHIHLMYRMFSGLRADEEVDIRSADLHNFEDELKKSESRWRSRILKIFVYNRVKLEIAEQEKRDGDDTIPIPAMPYNTQKAYWRELWLSDKVNLTKAFLGPFAKLIDFKRLFRMADLNLTGGDEDLLLKNLSFIRERFVYIMEQTFTTTLKWQTQQKSLSKPIPTILSRTSSNGPKAIVPRVID